ncbi:MAG TPA: tetratricopeptide repeat protein, partial [Pseudomonadota bacterium]|nr:tetratricopeptide repeat protein [Pseudomonadota bacterium]
MSDPRLRTRHAVLLAWFLLLLVVPAAPAAAGPHSPDDGCLNDGVCLGHYNHAVKLFEGGRFELALTEFQAAYRRRQMPWLLINIGRTLHRLGRPREALEYYDRHRQAEAKPDAETLDRLEKYTAQARAPAETNPTGAPPTPEPATDAAATPEAAAPAPAS